MDFIVIHGAPGSGKTTLAQEIHRRLQSPWFEFGWIPEFTKKNPHTDISQREEEQMSFENLSLVCKNYAAHGYENVILTDLNDVRLLDIPQVFAGYQYAVITLYAENESVLKDRILTRDNGNEFRDWESAITINARIVSRKPLPNEYRVRCDDATIAEIADRVQTLLAHHQQNNAFAINEYCRDEYSSYLEEYSDEGSIQ